MADTSGAMKKEKVWVKNFNTKPNFRNMINEVLGTDFKYADGCRWGETSQFWRDVTDKKSCVPKSDFVLDGKVGISFKSGKGRATSSNFLESKAIFLSTVSSNRKYEEDVDLVRLVEQMFELWAKTGTKIETIPEVTTTNLKEGLCEHAELSEYISVASEVSECLDRLREEYPEFMVDVVKECLTGARKFESRNQRATYYIRHSRKDINVIEFAAHVDSPEFLQECLGYLKQCKTAMKSSCGGSPTRSHWIRFM